MRLLSELTQEDAENFQIIVGLSFGNIIPRASIGTGGRPLRAARLLEARGMASGVSGQFSRPLMNGDDPTSGGLSGREFFLHVLGPDISDTSLPAVYLTPAAEELARLLSNSSEADVARVIVDLLPKEGLDRVLLWRQQPNGVGLVSPPETLWSADAPVAAV